MKIISNMSLADFKFYGGAEDTKDKLSWVQLEQVERELEAEYPDGMNAVDLNDLFRHDRDRVLEMAGYFPVYCQVTAKCGLVKDWEVNNAEELSVIEEAGVHYYTLHNFDYMEYEEFDETDFKEFVNIRYFKIWSRHAKRELILHCHGDAAEDLKDSFSMCEIEEIAEVPVDGIDGEEDWEDYEHDFGMIDGFAYDEDDMYNCYDIPVYAISRCICKLVLDPNDELDYYDIPESHAINEQNRYLELNDEDIENIDDFVADLHKAMPDGFTIDWDVKSVGSPSFEPHPAFGLAMDCVKLRIYPKD